MWKTNTARFRTRSLLLVVAAIVFLVGWYAGRRESVGVSFDNVLVSYRKRVIDDAKHARLEWVLFPPQGCDDWSYTGTRRDITLHCGNTKVSGTVGRDHTIWYVDDGRFKYIDGIRAVRLGDLQEYLRATPREERSARSFAQFDMSKN